MIEGVFTYLALKYPELGFGEKYVDYKSLEYVLEDQGVTIKYVDRSHLDKKVDPKLTENFISYLCYGDELINTTSPFLFIDNSRSWQVKWFAIAHEMGHFFLHPFLKDTLFKFENVEKLKNEILGRLEMEADYFANMVLIPNHKIDVTFEGRVRGELTKKNDISGMANLYNEIFNYCLDVTSKLLNIKIDNLSSKSILNLKFRVHRYLCYVREKLLIFHHDLIKPFESSLKGKEPFPSGNLFDKYIKIEENSVEKGGL